MKILYITTISSTMTFFTEHIRALVSEGHTVELACNCNIRPVPEFYKDFNITVHNIPFSRSPLSKSNLTAYKQLKKLIKDGKYDIIHTHTPNASLISRMCCRNLRKRGLKVIYTAHGFHFYKGAPLKNWLLFYPAEWLCSFWTDTLITINDEDFNLAKNKLHAKRVYLIPGVGLDFARLKVDGFSKNDYRKKLGISPDDIMLLSAGELNNNKNHALVIKSIAELKNPKIHYFIAGIGSNRDAYIGLAEQLQISEQIHLLGYRNDIAELNLCTDIFLFPSIREGLGMSAIEALYCQTPVCGMNTRGINEYVIDGETGYKFENNIQSCSQAINKMINTDSADLLKIKENCSRIAKKYDVKNVNEILASIYSEYSKKQ